MGILDWLKKPKSNVDLLDDLIWLTKHAKFTGISAATARCLNEPARPFAVLLVAHFQDCLEQLQTIIQQGGFDQRSVIAATAENLTGRSAPRLGSDDSQIIEIIVAERHPLQAHDTAVAEFAESLPCRCRLVHHVSLEDPLMRMFAGEWVQSVLKQLGIKENEAIESRMVTRRLQQAAQRIERQAVSDLPADSAGEWLERNCPDLWRTAQR
ncbi:MAG: hypothetical protein NTY19_13550 [Planctomycetota bacterium]|nr:hypothetical protein [Planctomycetota bacterium]